ncbi:MAG: rhomboid family intramembrane serine protease [Prevotella sp.]|nr:rhomboid family intramembrane serine protease [Prevotella sp.]
MREQMPPITKNLLIINILMFAARYVVTRYDIDLNALLGLHFFMASDFRPHQFITYLFMHGSFEHLFFNMFALWMFGRIIEQVMGQKRFLTYYMVCGIGAGLIQELVQYIHYLSLAPELSMFSHDQLAEALNMWNTVGASGAVYGILLAFGMTFPEERMFIIPIPVPIKAKYFVVGYAVIELLSAMLRSNDGVAHMAHLGGMLFGLFMLLHWRNPGGLQKKIRNWWAKHTAPKQRTFHYQKNTKFSDEMGYNQQRKARQEEIDRILAKVKEHGYGSLTEEEKRKLFEASGK